MPDLKISVWKAVRAVVLFIIGAIVAAFLNMPEAGLTLGGILVGIENWIRVQWEESKILQK